MSENESVSLPSAWPANPVWIRLKPFILVFIVLVGGLAGVPATSKSDVKGPPTYSKQEIHRAITVYAKRYQLDPALLRAVIQVESNFRQDAISRRCLLYTSPSPRDS